MSKEIDNTICPFCLEPSCREARDRKRHLPYLSCSSCGARAFLRAPSPGRDVLGLVVGRLGARKLGYLLRCYDPAVVLALLDALLEQHLDDQITDSLEAALHDFAEPSTAEATPRDLSRLLDQMDELEDWAG